VTDPTPQTPTPQTPAPQTPAPQTVTPHAGLPTAPASSLAPPGPERQAGTNGIAIASFVFGLLAVVPIGVILGIVALVQLRRRPRKGKGFAVAGLVLSGLWMLVLTLAVVAVIVSGPDRDATDEITGGGTVTAAELKPGDCVKGLRDTVSITTLPAVPCAEAHEGEIFAVFSLRLTEWPGSDAVLNEAEKGCQERLGAYEAAMMDDPALELMFLHPNAESWRAGDHQVTCMVVDSKGTRTGSVRR
jgi:hypothetical protein